MYAYVYVYVFMGMFMFMYVYGHHHVPSCMFMSINGSSVMYHVCSWSLVVMYVHGHQ